MRTILTLLRKDIATFCSNRTAVVLTFVVPIALIYIFGQVFGLNRKDAGPRGIRLGVVNASPNPAAQTLVDALKREPAFNVVTDVDGAGSTKEPLTEAEARRLIHEHTFNYAVVIPNDLLPGDRIGVHLKILSNPRNEIEAQLVNGLLQKTLFSNVPELLGQSLQNRARQYLGDERFTAFNRTVAQASAAAFGGDPAEIEHQLESGDYGIGRVVRRLPPTPADPALRRLDVDGNAPATAPPAVDPNAAAAGASTAGGADVFSRLIRIENEQVIGKDVKSPDATRVVGGWAIMFLLFAISGSSASFFDEQNTGIFQRLLSAPVSRAQLLISRFIHGILLGLVQLTALFLAGQLMYGIDVLGHLGLMIVASTAAAAACTSFGMLIAALAPNAAAANGLATFVVLVMSATGGAWWPISLMPDFMQTIGKATVVYWSMECFQAVLWANESLLQILPIVAVLLGITAVVMAIALWRLNRKPIFA